jgi:hypothetical protein
MTTRVARVVRAFTHHPRRRRVLRVAARPLEASGVLPIQHREIDRLADELYRLRQVVDAILAIAEELK